MKIVQPYRISIHDWVLLPSLIFTFAIITAAQPATSERCSSSELERDLSRFTITWQVIDGRLAIDANKSLNPLKPSPLFLCRLAKGSHPLTAPQAERELITDLAGALRQQPQFFAFAAQQKSGLPLAPDALRKGILDWTKARELLIAWVGAESDFAELMDAFITNSLNQSLAVTPLVTFDAGSDDRFDQRSGMLSLRVADPIADWNDAELFQFNLPPNLPNDESDTPGAGYLAPTREALTNFLTPLRGQLWRTPVIQAYLLEFFARGRSGYERTGDDLRVERDQSDGDRRFSLITVRAVPRITRIAVYGENRNAPLFQQKKWLLALRQLLTDEQFDPLRKPDAQLTECRSPEATDAEPSENPLAAYCQFLDLAPNSPNGQLPFLNQLNLRWQQQALAERGFFLAINPLRDENDELTNLVEMRIGLSEPPAAPKPADANTRADVTSPQNPANLSNTTDSADKEGLPKPIRCVEKPCLNWLGGGVAYRPGQGIRFFGQYVRQRLVGGDLSLRVGNHSGLLVTGSGSWDDVAFLKLKRRWAVELAATSDNLARRQLFGAATDERRTGGSFRTEFEASSNPYLFTLHLSGKQQTVEFTRGEQLIGKQNLTAFETGATFAAATRGASSRRVYQIEPVLRFGPGWGSGQSPFAVAAISALVHQYLPGRRDWLATLRLEQASVHTPIFELPFLGGAESIRGFRQDDAIGRRQWSLQNEFLFPVPGLRPEQSGLRATIREKLQLAAFADVGGIYQTLYSKPGARAGTGLGLRFQYGPHLLKLDWAYGFGAGQAGGGRGRFYLSFSRELPRLIRQ